MDKLVWGELPEGDFNYEFIIDDTRVLAIHRKNERIGIALYIREEPPVFKWFVIASGVKLSLVPALPDKPVVIKPEEEISIVPGMEYNSLIPIPYFIQLKYGTGKKAMILQEYPVYELSRSWFGESSSGELVYFHPGQLMKEISEYNDKEHYIFCPVNITNKSSQILTLERMIVRVPYLLVFGDGENLYSSKSYISFKGQDQISQLVLGKGMPYLQKHLKQVNTPRMKIDNNPINRSFYFIKSIYNG